MAWLNNIRAGLRKTTKIISGSFDNMRARFKVDDTLINDMEDMLICADFGITLASQIIAALREEKFSKEVGIDELKLWFVHYISTIMMKHEKSIVLHNKKPNVIMFVGANGGGKTTTVGKLAKIYAEEGKKILIGACDTFRAAAVEQLGIWGARLACAIISGAENADPSSVAYNAMVAAVNDKVDVLLLDTAGRLHNKQNLLDEIIKISRVLSKIDPTAPHETILVMDGTVGQNAMVQAEVFVKYLKVTGIIVTKLDGTAKAGAVLGIARKLSLPIYGLSIGEKVEDFIPFVAKDFVSNLFDMHI